MFDRHQSLVAFLDRQHIFVVIAQISRVQFSEREEVERMVFALEQISRDFSIEEI